MNIVSVHPSELDAESAEHDVNQRLTRRTLDSDGMPSLSETHTAKAGVSKGRSARSKRALAALALVLISFGGLSIANATPASAASGMTICLKTRTGLTISQAGALSEIYVRGNWYPTQLKSTGNNGCVAFYLSGQERNYPARIRVPAQRSGTNTIGYTTGWVRAGSLSYHFGTRQPWCVGFCYGY